MFAAAHRRAGNEVEIATLDTPESADGDLPECEIHAFGPGSLGAYHYEPRLEAWLRANRRRFDGVIVNGTWQYHGLAVRRAVAGRRPYVVFSHGMLDPYFMRRYPLKHLKKLIYWTLHEHRNLALAEAVCFTSEVEMRIAAEGFPFRHFKGARVPYGTMGPSGDPAGQKQAFLDICPAIREKSYLLFLGRLHPKKGCDMLLNAYAKTAPPNLDLVMVGPDVVGWRAELEAQAEHLGVANRVHWTGMLRGDAKWGAFYGAAAFVLSSHQENFGIAVADALACGTILLLSDKVNIAEEIASDGAALVEPDTLEGTVRLIERFAAIPDTERSAMQQRCRSSFEKRYTLRNSAQELYRALGLARP
jgi:glycosyltransferase involved in cell wall biosynthesis